MGSVLVTNIGELVTNSPELGDESVMGRLYDAALVSVDGVVSWVGSAHDAPACDDVIDCEGAAVVPGFVDSHTHLVFAGSRGDEFAARMAGERYDGGGIARTVAATRAASDGELRRASLARLAELQRSGVTTVEIKSGYDLTVSGEARLLRLARDMTLETTFLGAHSVPAEYRHDRDGYVSLVAGEMLREASAYARWADVFCDEGAFSVEEARHILTASRDLQLGLRLHGNQLADSGGVGLAVELGAASVDHCTYVSDHDIEALAGSDTVATFLPTAELCTRSPFPNARRFLDAGVTLALATDCNPGTSYVTNAPLVVQLAVTLMNFTVDEAIWAFTAGGARALRRDDIGGLAIGQRADAVVLAGPHSVDVAYKASSQPLRAVLRENALLAL